MGAVKLALGAARDVEIGEDILFHFILQNHLKLVDRPSVPVTVRALEIVGGKPGQRLNHEPESLKSWKMRGRPEDFQRISAMMPSDDSGLGM